VKMINDFKTYFLEHGEPVGENPSPGNKAGGISTLEDKALGCTQKGGHAPVCGVLSYGERIEVNGLNLLSAPGNDLVAATALAASGCQMVLFTTGRGTPFGTFVPTMKISTNSQLYQTKPNWIDFNAGELVEGTEMQTLRNKFIDKILAVANGEGYGNHKINEPEHNEDMTYVNWKLAVIPLLAVLIINFVITECVVWDPDILTPFQQMKGVPLVAAKLKNVVSIWALIISLVVGIVLALIVGKREIKSVDGLTKILNAGAIGSLLAIMNTASEVGYGNVISQLPGFADVAHFLINIHIGGTPLVSEAISVTVLAGITGSASGGMSIALELMSQDWLTWAQSIGMGPEILHRVASMASGGLDTLPHNGAVITLLAVCGLSHRESYKDIFAITLMKTFAVFVIILIYSVTGLH